MNRLPQTNEESRDYYRKKLERARISFEDTYYHRKERERTFRYYTGKQWSDTMKDPDTGETITEEQFIKKQGRTPAKQNLLGKTIRSIIGQFRDNAPDPVAFARARDNASAGEMMTSALQYALDINETTELDARNMEEFAISGMAGWKIGYKWWSELDREDIYISNIDVTRFFYNVDATDIRGHDIMMMGELHDLSMDELISKFNIAPSDIPRIKDMFPSTGELRDEYKYPQYMYKHRDFYTADNPNALRVVEVWEKEYEDQYFLHDSKDGTFQRVTKQTFIDMGYPAEIVSMYSMEEFVQELNKARRNQAMMQGVNPDVAGTFTLDYRNEEVWKACFLSTNGDVIASMETPYEHQQSPYIFGRYMMDGKIMSLGESLVDQQRHVNRLISMIDASLGKGLKQVKMIDVDSIPAQYKGNLQEYADEMVKMGNFVFYTSNKGTSNMPKELSSQSVSADAMNLLNLQAELMKDLSAVNDAVQGKEPNSGTPSSLYAQQTLNAAITNKDIFDFYFAMIRKRNRKVVQVIKQFYNEARQIKISGVGYTKGVDAMYEPDTVKDVDFDVVIGESQSTLAYRQSVDMELKEFLSAQFITFEEYLETTSMPYADKLLQIINNRNDQQGQINPEQLQAMMQQNQNGGNPAISN